MDFCAEFDGLRWQVAWKWKGELPVLKNKIAQYAVNENVRAAFDAELIRWIENGWLEPCSPFEDGIIPLLAVQQKAKNKVKPVLDFRELNEFVQSHTTYSEVCPETIRKW